MAEMTPSSIRGAVVSAKETVIVFGILMGYWAGDCCLGLQAHWTVLYALSGVLALPMLALTFFIPRSVRWLLMHGHQEEAAESFRFVFKGDDKERIRSEFNRLAASLENSSVVKHQQSLPATSDDDGCLQLLFQKLLSRPVRPAFTAAMGLITFQQFSGQPSIISYAAVVFDAAGWSGHASVVTALLMMCVSMTTVLTVEHLGRKRLLYLCCAVLMTSAYALSWQFWGWADGVEGREFGSAAKIVILFAMFFYIGGK